MTKKEIFKAITDIASLEIAENKKNDFDLEAYKEIMKRNKYVFNQLFNESEEVFFNGEIEEEAYAIIQELKGENGEEIDKRILNEYMLEFKRCYFKALSFLEFEPHQSMLGRNLLNYTDELDKNKLSITLTGDDFYYIVDSINSLSLTGFTKEDNEDDVIDSVTITFNKSKNQNEGLKLYEILDI